MKRALILVDIQRDFLPGGALAVPHGDEVIPVANALQGAEFDCVVASQDFHPANHGSFASNHAQRAPGEVVDLHGVEQILWPDHCVEGTSGAAFADALERDEIDRVFPKGTDPTVDSYSAFFDNARRNETGLEAYLRAEGVSEVYLAGLATDYCVKFTALDACERGFKTFVVRDACRGVELSPGDSERAFAQMRQAGAHLVSSDEVLS